MERHDELHAYLTNSSQNKSDFITRKPLLLLRQLKKCNEEERCAINKTLNELRSKFPAELKFGAALNTEDSFFDAVAQGLNDLRAKGSITRRNPFHVTSLRLCQKVDCDEIRVEDDEAHVGIPLIEGRIICQKFNVRIVLRELLPNSDVNEICSRISKETSVGDSLNVVYIVKHDGHYVPLLSSLQKDVEVRMKVPRNEVYGRSSNLKSFDANSTSVPSCTIENSRDGSREMLNGSTEGIAENSRNHSIAFNAKNGVNDSNMFQRDSHNDVGQRKANHRKTRKRKTSPSVESVEDIIILCDETETKKDSCERGQSNPDLDIATKRKKTKIVESLIETIIISDERETKKDSREEGQTNPDHEKKAKRKKRQLASVKITNRCDERERNKNSTKIVADLQAHDDADVTFLCEVSSDLQFQGAERIGGNNEHPSVPKRQKRNVADERETKKDSCERRQANRDHEKAAKRRKRQPLGSVKITNICDERERNKDYSKIVADLQAPDADVTFLCEVSSDLQFQNGHFLGAERIGGNNEHPSVPKRPKRNVAVDVEATRLRDLPGNSRYRSTSRNIVPQKRFVGGTADSVTKTPESVNGNNVSDGNCDDGKVEILTLENANADCSRATEASKVSTPARKNPRRISTSTSATKTMKNVLPFMNIIDLAVLCLGRKSTFKSKYRSLTMKFEDPEIDYFSHIVLRQANKSVHIRVVNLCNNFEVKKIGCSELFSKSNHSFSIHSYFNSFLKYAIALNKLPINVNHLVLYTNCELNFDNELVLRPTRTAKSYPFKFVRLEDSDILKDFLSTQDNDCQGFYKFSEEESNKHELMIRLQCDAVGQKYIQSSKLKWKHLKEMFLDKLIFAVNQPDREKLAMLVKKETREAKSEKFYPQLKEKILRVLTQDDKYGFQFIYPFHVTLALLHTLFLHGQMVSINCQSKNAENGIVVNYRQRLTYINAAYMEGSIGYGHLFPTKTSSAFSLNKLFARFIEEFGRNENMRYFFILTNGYLSLDDNDTIKGSSVKVQSVDIGKKKYKVLRNCSFIKSSCIYQFAVQEEETKQNLLRLLEFPQSSSNDIPSAEQEQLKVEFLNKLLMACRQPIRRELIDLIKTDIEQSEVPYSYFELQEVTLRWLESIDRGGITKELLEKLLSDIKNNRLSGRKIERNIEEEIMCARSIASRCKKDVFDDFLEFLVEGEGHKCLEILRKQGLKPRCMSSILNNATNPKEAFVSLFRLWFNEEGEKSMYLKSLENEGIPLRNMTGILACSGVLGAMSFKELYRLWFDETGRKSQYLRNVERANIRLSNITTILGRSGVEASRAFKELYELLFDQDGNESHYLESLEKAGISFMNMSTLLGCSGRHGKSAFQALHKAWIDPDGNKSKHLKTVVDHGIELRRIASILDKSGVNAPAAFEELYYTWFDDDGHKTGYLISLERHKIAINTVSGIIGGAGIHAAKAFKELYRVWFDEKGQKTRYLLNLELNGIHLTNISNILCHSGANGARAFVELYSALINESGEKTERLKDFIDYESDNGCFELANISNILSLAGARAKMAFEKLHSALFDKLNGRERNRLYDLIIAGFTPRYITSLLAHTNILASSRLKTFHGVCFDEDGKVTPNLNDFYKAGFTTNDICNALTSSAAITLKQFHDFCFGEETKHYIDHFLKYDGFTPSNISNVLHGSKIKICSALKDLHNMCFSETGEKTQLLNDFEEVGFTLSHLCRILGKTGINAPSILKYFHGYCFNEKSYLKTLLTENNLFTPNILSEMLERIGTQTSARFEKLYNLCFDRAGKKTTYFSNLLEKHSPSKIIVLLRSKIRKD